MIMKRLGLIIAGWMALTVQAWALTATGMPALDELRADAAKNGPLSQRLGFSGDQRKDIVALIDKESEDLVPLRDEMVAAEKRFDAAKKNNKGAAREEMDAARNKMNAARDAAFKRLKKVTNDAQFEALKKWRAEGKANVR